MKRQQANEEQQEEEATCPECEGTNLNEDKTLCFNCQSEDFE